MKIENIYTFNISNAFRGMRNPLESWDRSDSIFTTDETFYLGEKDKELAQRLIKAGNEHRKFMRQIIVSLDLTAPLYFWKEFDTYKVGTTANSTSTMHKLASTPITEECFELENLDVVIDEQNCFYDYFEKTMIMCEVLRNKYNKRRISVIGKH